MLTIEKGSCANSPRVHNRFKGGRLTELSQEIDRVLGRGGLFLFGHSSDDINDQTDE